MSNHIVDPDSYFAGYKAGTEDAYYKYNEALQDEIIELKNEILRLKEERG